MRDRNRLLATGGRAQAASVLRRPGGGRYVRRIFWVIALAALLVGGCASLASRSASVHRGEQAGATAPPNIVFILTDDLSNNLLQYMPNVQALAQRGMSFTNYTVAD